ncbi:hypothetical protein JAAARDRAFT_28693 [Jaapia argillacea MUCL 33604]|uniref:Alcohol dehydrogenase-like N-terminal domain-containing protein n=1 Tax=Jaapia argillacea MUCL 33604 TaxID=933084 RepID=A0A067QD91_9AGAM|nr:hypothetical protein JAAARDRAFT_28693 [Jaapia argillacea MUCL 33604]
MPKPTLFQTLFNKPSRSYAFPPSKDYYSTKQELIRIAAEIAPPDASIGTAKGAGVAGRTSLTLQDIREVDDSPGDNVQGEGGTPAQSLSDARNRISSIYLDAKDTLEDSDDEEPAHVQSHSRTAAPSLISLNKNTGRPNNIPNFPHQDVTSASSLAHVQKRLRQEMQSPRPVPALVHEQGDSDDADDETDVFYTPQTSPHTSMALSDTPFIFPVDPVPTVSHIPASVSRAQPLPKPFVNHISRNVLSSSPSSSSESLNDNVSIFTNSTLPSTHITTPVTSDCGHTSEMIVSKNNKSANGIKSITIVSSSGHRASGKTSAPSSNSLIISGPTTLRPSNKQTLQRRSQSASAASRSEFVQKRQALVVDDDWAKDVRWLGPPPANGSARTRTNTRSSSAPPSSAASSASWETEDISTAGSSRKPEPKPKKKGKGKGKDRVRKQMSALFEEEEGEDDSGSGPGGAPVSVASKRLSREYPAKRGASRSPSRPRPRTHSSPTTSPRTSVVGPSSAASTSSRRQSVQPQSSPSASTSRLPTRSQSLSYAPTHTLPTPIPSSSTMAAQGYSALVLPRATPALGKSKMTIGDGKVDLTRSGMASTTMMSIEIVRGVAATVKSKRRLSFSLRGGAGGSLRGKGKAKEKEGHVRLRSEEGVSGSIGGGADDLLALTSHLSPPTYVPSSCVLLQVWAVGLCGVDSMLVAQHSKSGKGVGFIPGRSFVGRVVEAGVSVREEVVRKGDWAVGLCDLKKCGALAEFLVVERHRLLRITMPHPSTPSGLQRSTSRSTMKSRASYSSAMSTLPPPGPPPLTLEELALLPLCGVPAIRAARTFERFLGLGRSGRARPRALILRGHDGVGAMVVQLLSKKGVEVAAHVPYSQVTSAAAEVERRLKIWGAEEVCFGGDDEGIEHDAVVKFLQRLGDDGEEFDMILDTVGGREVWRACQPILRTRGGKRSTMPTPQFTTLVGDVTDRAIPSVQDHFWAGFRSMGLKRNDSIKEGSRKKDVGYSWVSFAADVDWEGENVRDSLAGVVEMVEEGTVRPWAGDDGEEFVEDRKILPFERAPEVFRRDEWGPRGILSGGGTVVVKLVG